MSRFKLPMTASAIVFLLAGHRGGISDLGGRLAQAYQFCRHEGRSRSNAGRSNSFHWYRLVDPHFGRRGPSFTDLYGLERLEGGIK